MSKAIEKRSQSVPPVSISTAQEEAAPSPEVIVIETTDIESLPKEMRESTEEQDIQIVYEDDESDDGLSVDAPSFAPDVRLPAPPVPKPEVVELQESVMMMAVNNQVSQSEADFPVPVPSDMIHSEKKKRRMSLSFRI